MFPASVCPRFPKKLASPAALAGDPSELLTQRRQDRLVLRILPDSVIAFLRSDADSYKLRDMTKLDVPWSECEETIWQARAADARRRRAWPRSRPGRAGSGHAAPMRGFSRSRGTLFGIAACAACVWDDAGACASTNTAGSARAAAVKSDQKPACLVSVINRDRFFAYAFRRYVDFRPRSRSL